MDVLYQFLHSRGHYVPALKHEEHTINAKAWELWALFQLLGAKEIRTSISLGEKSEDEERTAPTAVSSEATSHSLFPPANGSLCSLPSTATFEADGLHSTCSCLSDLLKVVGSR